MKADMNNMSGNKIYSKDEVEKSSLEYFNGDDFAAKVFMDKYALADGKGGFFEKNPSDMHRRIAKEFARVESKKFKNPYTEEEIFSAMDKFNRIVPQGSPLYGIGNKSQFISLSNCYVIESPQDSYGAIMSADESLVQISKRRGGVGVDLSHLRPENAPTRNAARTSTGVVSFASRFSNSIREVGQHGRRGALMLTLNVHHPDILAFVKAKRDLTKITGANMSVRLTDEFLKAVDAGEKYQQRWPVDAASPEISNTIDAKEIWDAIVENAHHMAEPGLLFWDNIVNESPSDCYSDCGFETISTNPCVTADTWVMTSKGPRKVHQLVGKPFVSMINGVPYLSDNRGFYKTGNKQVVKINTERGLSIECTHDHLILVDDGKSHKWVEASNLNHDSMIVISNNKNTEWEGRGEYLDGRRAGMVFSMTERDSDGRLHISSRNKRKLNEDFIDCNSAVGTIDDIVIDLDSIEVLSSEFYKGYLSCIFDERAKISFSKSSFSIKINIDDQEKSEMIHRMLLRLGIVSKIFIKNNGKFSIEISDVNAKNFTDIVGFESEAIRNKITNGISNCNMKRESYTDRVSSIAYGDVQDVYDCTIPIANRFEANGIIVHNCSEIPLSAFDSCRLMLLNCFGYVNNPFTDKAEFNFDLFSKDAMMLQRLMDDLVDLEIECIDRIISKIESDPEPIRLKDREINLWKNIRKAAVNGRRTGSGMTGIGDMIAAMGMPYASDEGIAFIADVYKKFKLACYRSSVEMAKELGAFPIFDAEKESKNPFLNRIKDQDIELWQEMQHYGRRNIALLTTAPCGSVSNLTQTSSGIEPQFSIMPYTRRKKGNPGDVGFRSDFVDANGDHWMEFKIFPPKVKMWMEITGKDDLSQSPWSGSTANELDWKKRVELQASVQKEIDHAISSTLNLPNNVSVSSVDEIYRTAWKSGCKGITIYRDGCRDGVLITSPKETKKSEDEILPSKAPKRPSTLNCHVHHISAKGDPFVVVVGLLKEKPYEVFACANHGKDDSNLITKNFQNGTLTKESRGKYRLDMFDKSDNKLTISNINDKENGDEAALTRMISTALRHGADISFVVQQLEKVKGDMFAFSKAVSRTLKKYIPNGTEVTGETCENCQTKDKCALIRQEGCVTCKSCGWSKCS